MPVIYDFKTPQGRVVSPRLNIDPPAPCTTRKMTEEERAFYGEAVKPKDYKKPPSFACLSPDASPKGNKTDPVFGQRLKEELDRRGISDRQFCKLIGVSATTVANIKVARHSVKDDVKMKICEVLGWEVEK